jgi:hypothetical protein
MHITPTSLNIAGLIFNILGTIILAFSLNGYIRSMRLAIDAHELYILSVNSTDKSKPIIQITGTDVHMNRDRKRAGLFSWLGIFLVVAGFVLQLYSYIV